MTGLQKNEFDARKGKAHEASLDDLKRMIDGHEAISFDIFDTLLIRKTLLPGDVFALIQYRALQEGMILRNFCELRRRAQEENEKKNPDIYDIYEKFQVLCGVNDYVKSRLIRLELEVEQSVLLPRRPVVNAMQYALDSGKKVYLVSDMYIPQEELEPVLTKMGICGYEEMLVSCDYKKLKMEGLFEELKRKIGNLSCLHIGDHTVYDGFHAARAGMDVMLLDSPLELLKKSSWGRILEEIPPSVNERSLLGLVISIAFEDPFVFGKYRTKEQILSQKESIISLLVAPLVVTFMDWFVKRVQNRGYEAVLFASRDGFLIRQLYDVFRNRLELYDLPEGIYFQTSRKAATAMNMDSEAMINNLVSVRGELAPDQVLERLFSLQKEDIMPFPEGEEWDKEIYNYVWRHQGVIFKRTEEAKRNFFRYMGRLNLKIGKKYAFYDFVSSGTTQRILKKIAPFELEGLYFGWNNQEDAEELPVRSMFSLREGGYFMRSYKLLEMLMTSDQPSLSSFDDQGRPVLEEERRDGEDLKFLLNVQKNISDFLSDFLDHLYIFHDDFGKETGEKIFQCLDGEGIFPINAFWRQMYLVDDWKGTGNLLGELLQ